MRLLLVATMSNVWFGTSYGGIYPVERELLYNTIYIYVYTVYRRYGLLLYYLYTYYILYYIRCIHLLHIYVQILH